jgi:hypothetical protein
MGVNLSSIQKIIDMRQPAEPKEVKLKPVRTTPEQEAMHDFQSSGMARRKAVPIDNLLKRNLLDDRRHAALTHYAEIKALADSSIVKDSIGKLLHPSSGNGYGPSPKLVNARREAQWIERELGTLLEITLFVVHELHSLTKWVRLNGGGRIKCETVKGKKVYKEYADKHEIDMALLDLRLAADRVQAAIDARKW